MIYHSLKIVHLHYIDQLSDDILHNKFTFQQTEFPNLYF